MSTTAEIKPIPGMPGSPVLVDDGCDYFWVAQGDARVHLEGISVPSPDAAVENWNAAVDCIPGQIAEDAEAEVCEWIHSFVNGCSPLCAGLDDHGEPAMVWTEQQTTAMTYCPHCGKRIAIKGGE